MTPRPAPAPQQFRQPVAATPPAPRPSLPPPTIRTQGDDIALPPPPAPRALERVSMPAPEELGVQSARPAVVAVAVREVDWTADYQRLRELGATSFQLDRLAEGGFRVTCLLATNEPDRLRRIEARGATEAEVVRLARTEAETWIARRK